MRSNYFSIQWCEIYLTFLITMNFWVTYLDHLFIKKLSSEIYWIILKSFDKKKNIYIYIYIIFNLHFLKKVLLWKCKEIFSPYSPKNKINAKNGKVPYIISYFFVKVILFYIGLFLLVLTWNHPATIRTHREIQCLQ